MSTDPLQLLIQSLDALKLGLPDGAAQGMIAFLDEVLEANRHLNLTSIEYPQAVTKHLVDSLAALSLEPLRGDEGPWLDLGSGAGIPGIPLALARPGLPMILVESTRKKGRFLEQVVEKFGLKDRVKVEDQRAETLGRGPLREGVSQVFCRAVGSLPVLLELAMPLLKSGGGLVAYKGPKAWEEVEKSSKALQVLQARVDKVLEFSLPFSGESRSLVYVKKVGKTPDAYPRLPGTPAKSPLC